MSEIPQVVVHHRDVPIGERLLASIERRCSSIADEFSEASRFEVSFEPSGAGVIGHVHATGRHTDLSIHAEGSKPAIAADRVFDKIERQLRRVHDKRIFGRRREARRDLPKRQHVE